MKTITEFSGFQLRTFLDKKRELQQAHRPAGASRPNQGPKPKAVKEAEAPAIESAAVEAAPPESLEASTAETSIGESSVSETPVVEAAPVEPAAPSLDERFKQFISETTKWEGQKLEFALHAVTAVLGGDRHRIKDLKRVVVLQGAEGQAAPKGAVEATGHFFLPEYLPSLEKPKGRPGRGDRKGAGRGGRRGGKGDGRRGPGGRGGRGDGKHADGKGGGQGQPREGRERRPRRLAAPAPGQPNRITPVNRTAPSSDKS